MFKWLIVALCLTLPLFCYVIYLAWVDSYSLEQNADLLFKPSTTQLSAIHPEQSLPESIQTFPANFKIQWGIIPEAPFFILNGPDQNKGFCDVLLARLQHFMPAVQHHVFVESHTKLRQRQLDQQNICSPCIILKSKQAQQSDDVRRIYSKPMHYFKAHGLITHKQLAPVLIKTFGQPIVLPQLLKSEYRFAYPVQRKYGGLQPLIDQYKQEHPDATTIYQGEDAGLTIMQLLATNRIDYTIEYESILRVTASDIADQLSFIPIQSEQPWLKGAIGCTDNAWGRQAINRINQVAAQIHQDPEFLQSLQYWVGQDIPVFGPGTN